MKIYVLQVLTGKEIEIRDRLIGRGLTAYVPQETTLLHREGRWFEETRVVFGGYVFVGLRFCGEEYYSLRKTDGIIKFLELRNGETAALTDTEAERIRVICQTGDPLPLSVVEVRDGKPVPISGVLKEYADNTTLIKYNMHRRRATLTIPFHNEWKTISLSFKVLKNPNTAAG